MRALVAILVAALLLGGATLTTVVAQDDSRTDAARALERAGAVVIEGNVRERSSASGARALERAGSRLSGDALERAVAARGSSIERAAVLATALERAGARSRGLSPLGGGMSATDVASALERASSRSRGAESDRTPASIANQASERATANLDASSDEGEEEELQTLERSGSRLSALRPSNNANVVSNATERAGATLTAIVTERSGAAIAVQAVERASATERSGGSAASMRLPESVRSRLSGLTPDGIERVSTGAAQERSAIENEAAAGAVTEASARLNGLDPQRAAGSDVTTVLERANTTLMGTSQERATATGASFALAQAGARLNGISPESDPS